MRTYRVALIPGDGIGREVIPEAPRVLRTAAQGFSLSFQELDGGRDYYLRTGRMMPEDGREQLRPVDALLLGAMGHPSLPDHLGGVGAAEQIFAALRAVTAEGRVRTPGLGGMSTIAQFLRSVIEKISG